jgi:hypothetical protein
MAMTVASSTGPKTKKPNSRKATTGSNIVTTPDAGVQAEDEELSSAESKLLAAAGAGKFLILRAGSIELNDELHDPASGPLWTEDQMIRAEVLVDLLTGKTQPGARPPRHVMLGGARITGSLDLLGATLVCPLWLWDCHIEHPVNLNEATAPWIRLPGCHMPLLAADGLRTDRDLVLDEKCTVSNEILLRGARIGGQLSLRDARITSLVADRLAVEGSLFCDNGFTAHGEVCLRGARIGGQLSFDSAHLINPDGTALAADRLNVANDIIASGVTAQGEIRLLGAHISGQLNLDGASLANPGGMALAADRLTVDDAMLCGSGFRAEGEVRLLGARISGQLNFDGATLANASGYALAAEGLSVGQSMFCGPNFDSNGEVRLAGAHIASHLTFDGASLANLGGQALTAQMLTVDQGLSCGEGFSARGEITLTDARIGGRLDLVGATLSNPGGIALYLARAQVATMFLLPARSPDGSVILANARVGSFADDPASWPATLGLHGFAYDKLENTAVTVKQRLDWLRRNEGGYTPQIYDQLAAAYRSSGDRSTSRKVEVAKQRRCRSPFNPLNWLWFLTVGYGYRTWWAGIWLVALVAMGTIIFGRAYPGHMIAVRTHPPAFHAVGYALDTLLPIVDLGEKSAWQPEGTTLYWSWGMTLAGWTLTTAVVAGLTGVLKRD